MEEVRYKAEMIFKREIEPLIADKDPQWFVAIDADSGDFEVHANELEAMDRLRARNPFAKVWLRRVGSQVAHRFLSSRVIRT